MGKGYQGYLRPMSSGAMHRTGVADTRAIAETLYRLGARSSTTDPNIPRMQRAHHVGNLRLMVLHVLQRHE